MIDYEKGLYVTICQSEQLPAPLPLNSGFSLNVAYRVLGIYNPSESGECWLIMSNDRNELWFISQRQVRTYALESSCTSLRIDV